MMNPQPDVPPEPVVDPPIKLFNFNEEAMQILTAVPPVRQQFGLISRRILDGVLVMNQMDMLIPAKALKEELEDLVYTALDTRGFHSVRMDNPAPPGEIYVPLCDNCHVVEASQLFVDCTHLSCCNDCLTEALLNYNPEQPHQLGQDFRMAPCPTCYHHSLEGLICQTNIP